MNRRRAEPGPAAIAAAALLAIAAGGAQAQQGEGAGGVSRGWALQPRVSLMQTWTDNLRLDDRNKDAALITTLAPGISLLSNAGAVRGSLDYSLYGIAYLKSDAPSQLQNSLAANLRAEVIGDTLFVDARANIGQQSGSAFGLQSTPTLGSRGAVSNLVNANQHETRTLAVSPLLRGFLGPVASYELRGDATRTAVRGATLGDSHGTGGSLRVSQRDPGVAGWWLLASTQRHKSAGGRSGNRNDFAKAGLNYRPDVDWLFTASVGQERNDYLGGGSQDGVTGGMSVQWTPSPRTSLGADWQHHDYGDSHALSVQHRTARSVWHLSDTRNITLGNIGAAGGVRSNYDQFYQLFASLEPDPVQRDLLVRAYLQSQGLSPDASVAGGFLSAGPSQVHSQMLGVTLQGVRSSLSLQAIRTVTSRLGENLNQGDLANTSRVEQRSYSLTASHQLTPLWGLSLTAARQQSAGDLASQAMTLTSWTANCNARLAPRLNAQLGARHSRFEGTAPYTENAVYASLTQQF
ncbi:MAG: TIGR03016 family PEP-CTERM system-associated outer membrane protein [Roseateles sp.]|uniref:TIGR03016 family PEP-CTERM system-associated outer membrane protein n=1 Tax=Roseateles sp. TaxID=1971397 RepID=UPI0039EA98F4